jgi:hypothetical protein
MYMGFVDADWAGDLDHIEDLQVVMCLTYLEEQSVG